MAKAMDLEPGQFTKKNVECFHPIRDVSTTSHMYCVSFRLPWQVAMSEVGSPTFQAKLAEKGEKKQKTD